MKLPDTVGRWRYSFVEREFSSIWCVIDWRTKGYVTPVKDQGQKAGKSAFAVTGAIEGQNFNATGKLISLSEENLLDCVPNPPCQDFEIDEAYKYVIKNGGIDSETGYPFETGCHCRYDPVAKGATISAYRDIRPRDENALQQAVATIGPISTSIDASHSSFQLYRSGSKYFPLVYLQSYHI